MGKGDKKSRKGKIWRGSYGNSRPRKKKTGKKVIVKKPAKAVKEVKAPEEAKKPAKKAPAKKAAKKAE